ncbi:thioredoxin [bacterium]|nr:thioredoxin [bacterium]
MSDTKYVTLTDDNFQSEVLDSPKVALVDFWADWCGPCHMIAPAIEELATEFEGKATVGKLDVDDNPRIAEQYGIRSIPSLLFFLNGQIVDQIVGVAPKQELADKLDRLLQNQVN